MLARSIKTVAKLVSHSTYLNFLQVAMEMRSELAVDNDTIVSFVPLMTPAPISDKSFVINLNYLISYFTCLYSWAIWNLLQASVFVFSEIIHCRYPTNLIQVQNVSAWGNDGIHLLFNNDVKWIYIWGFPKFKLSSQIGLFCLIFYLIVLNCLFCIIFLKLKISLKY